MSEIECTQFKHVGKGVLVASFNIFVPKWGVEIFDMSLCMKDGKRWINFPQSTYEKDGEKKYWPYVKFRDKAHHELFQEKVKQAIDKYCESQNSISSSHDDDEIPF